MDRQHLPMLREAVDQRVLFQAECRLFHTCLNLLVDNTVIPTTTSVTTISLNGHQLIRTVCHTSMASHHSSNLKRPYTTVAHLNMDMPVLDLTSRSNMAVTFLQQTMQAHLTSQYREWYQGSLLHSRSSSPMTWLEPSLEREGRRSTRSDSLVGV